MSNKDLIQEIINGATPQIVEVPFNGETLTFNIRPLTNGELSKLQEIENKPLTVTVNVTGDVKSSKNNASINNAELVKAQNSVIVQAVSWGLSVSGEPPVKPEIVEQLPKELPPVLFEKIMTISNISDDDLKLVKRFR